MERGRLGVMDRMGMIHIYYYWFHHPIPNLSKKNPGFSVQKLLPPTHCMEYDAVKVVLMLGHDITK